MPIDFGQGPIQIQAPIDLSQLTQTEHEQIADQIISTSDTPYTRDEIIGALAYLERNGIHLDQGHIDRIEAGDPVLTPAENLQTLDVSNLQSMTGNPWLAPNPFALITINYLELAFILSQIKLQEAQEASEAIIQMAALAVEIAELIIEIGEAEATAHIVAGCMAIASGVMSIAGGAWAGRAKSGPAMQARVLQVQGAGGIMQGVGQIVQGVMALKKATLEAIKTITENMLKVAERRLNSALEAYRTADELITQILQNLQKIIDEAYKAHGFSTR